MAVIVQRHAAGLHRCCAAHAWCRSPICPPAVLTFRSKYLLFSPYLAQTLTALQCRIAHQESEISKPAGGAVLGWLLLLSLQPPRLADLVDLAAWRGRTALRQAPAWKELLRREAIAAGRWSGRDRGISESQRRVHTITKGLRCLKMPLPPDLALFRA